MFFFNIILLQNSKLNTVLNIYVAMIWAAAWQNQQEWPVRPAKTQIKLGIHPVWSESSLSAHWVAKVMRTVKTLIRQGGCPAWYVSLLGAQIISLVLSCYDSFWYFGIHLPSLRKKKKFYQPTNPPLGLGETKIFIRVARYCNAASIFKVEGCLVAIIYS